MLKMCLLILLSPPPFFAVTVLVFPAGCWCCCCRYALLLLFVCCFVHPFLCVLILFVFPSRTLCLEVAICILYFSVIYTVSQSDQYHSKTSRIQSDHHGPARCSWRASNNLFNSVDGNFFRPGRLQIRGKCLATTRASYSRIKIVPGV